MESYFALDGDTVLARAHGGGPWDPTVLHGGAPAGLIAHLAEQIPSAQPMRTTRLTIDLKRPVPIGPLSIRRTITREGRNIQTCTITLSAGEKDVVDAHVLRMADRPLALPEGVGTTPLQHARPEDGTPWEGFRSIEGFNSTVEQREVPSPYPGNRATWFNVERPFIDGVATTPMMRAAASADYCNALGVPLDFRTWTYINADLTIHFARTPVGEWMLLDGHAIIGPDGRGLAHGTLSDSEGAFGRAIQSLVIAPR